MKTKQLGFTLIELVVVIVLLGIIGAVATARFQDLATDAADAAEKGVAAELASASAINYAASTLPSFAGLAIQGTIDCDADIDGLFQTQTRPADITFNDGTNVVCGAAGDVIQCEVHHAKGTATDAVASLICTG